MSKSQDQLEKEQIKWKELCRWCYIWHTGNFTACVSKNTLHVLYSKFPSKWLPDTSSFCYHLCQQGVQTCGVYIETTNKHLIQLSSWSEHFFHTFVCMLKWNLDLSILYICTHGWTVACLCCWIILNQQSKPMHSFSLSQGACQFGTQWTPLVCFKQEPSETAQKGLWRQQMCVCVCVLSKHMHPETQRDRRELAAYGHRSTQECRPEHTHVVIMSTQVKVTERKQTQRYTWPDSQSCMCTFCMHHLNIIVRYCSTEGLLAKIKCAARHRKPSFFH